MKIAIFQQQIIANNADANFAQVRSAFEGVDADMLVVPETFNVGFGGDMAATAEVPEGPSLALARAMAREHDALFVGSWCVKEEDKVFNRLHWVRPDGSYGHYDKRHTFRTSKEFEQVTRGNETATFDYKGWRIRAAVCYDLRFPLWLRNKDLDYDLLLFCANWPASRRDTWSTLLKARAIENQCYVIGANCCGAHYSGDSMIVDFKGLPLVQATAYANEVIRGEIDKTALEDYRKKWPFYMDADI